MGTSAIAKGLNSIAMGYNAQTAIEGDIAIGVNSKASGTDIYVHYPALAIGDSAEATDANTIAIGHGAVASNMGTTALGADASATGSRSSALGRQAKAVGGYSVAVGGKAETSGSYAVAMGETANASEVNATAIGSYSRALAAGASAFGAGAIVESGATNSVAIGTGATVNQNITDSVALGANSEANESNTVSVGSAGNERRIMNVAAGTYDTDAVNLSQLKDVNSSATITDFNLSGSTNTLLTLKEGNNTFSVDLNDTKTALGLQNEQNITKEVARAKLAEGDLNLTNGGGDLTQGINLNTQSITEVNATAEANKAELAYFEMNATSSKTPASATATGALAAAEGAVAGDTNATAIGSGAHALAAGASAFGAGAIVESGATNSVAISTGATVKSGVTNAVALGAGSVATESDTVSVGDLNNTRRITNVAAGTHGTDAVNVDQLNTQVATGYNSAFTLSGTNNTNLSITDGNGTLSVDLSTVITPTTIRVNTKYSLMP